MNFFSDLFNSIIGKKKNEVEENEYNAIPKLVGPNESCIIRKFRPNFLDQGKTLHREQSKRSDALRSNIRAMNERMSNSNNIEGFGDMTASKNSSDLSETTTLSNSFDKNIERYNKEYPLFIDETRNAGKLNDRNKNIKDNSSLFTNSDNNFYDITYEKEGCYKSAGAPGLELQTDLKDVSVNTCKMRASDLGYSGFAIRKGSGGQLGCYLSKDISTAKAGGIATKPVTSLAFKTSNLANMGGLLFNGQLGIYNNTIDNNLVTDLEGIQGCDAKSSDFFINEKSVVATWGGNCNVANAAAPVPAPVPAPTDASVSAPAAKNKIAIDLINTVFNYLDQILISVKNITSARNQNANNSGLVSFNYVTLAKKQLTEAISAINSNNYTQATANINSSLPNIANGAAFCLMAFAIINANQATKDYVTGLGTNAKKNLESAIKALA